MPERTKRSDLARKIDLILKAALNPNPQGTCVIISDVDIRFFRPIRPFIDEIANGDYDIVFQRDEDRSLQGQFRIHGDALFSASREHVAHCGQRWSRRSDGAARATRGLSIGL